MTTIKRSKLVSSRGLPLRSPRSLARNLPKLYPEQTAAFYTPVRLSLCEASTKAGKTHGGMRWALGEALRGPNRTVWWVAPVYAQAKMVMRRYLRSIGPWVHANNSELTLEFRHGSKLWFKSAKNPNNLYGEDVHAALIDEASRVNDDSVVAVRSTITSTGGPWRMIGNVRGRNNMFYRLCRQAESGDLPNSSYHKITAAMAAAQGIPGLPTFEELEDARAVLPPAVYAELYEVDPSSSDTSPFGHRNIDAATEDLCDDPVQVFGIDLAKSVDYTVIIGLCRDMHVCYWYRVKDLPWPKIIELVQEASEVAPTLIDSTGVGSPVLDYAPRAEGYVFTQRSKQHLMQRLNVALGNGLTFPEEVAEEMHQFEYQYRPSGVRYSAPEGYHDDQVMALALAVEQAYRHRGYSEFYKDDA